MTNEILSEQIVEMDTSIKIGYYSCCPEPYPSVIFKMHLRRRSLYYVYKIMFPSCLIALLAILSFCLPTSSGERVTLLITNFVSLALFILMLSTIVPPTSETTPLLEVYLTAVFVEISAALVLRCIIDAAKRKNGRPGYFIRKFICYYLARILNVKPLARVEVASETDTPEVNLELDNIDLNIPNDIEVVRAVYNNGKATDTMTERAGVIHGVTDDNVPPIHADVEEYFSMADEACQIGSNCMDQRFSKASREEFRKKVLSVLESVSESVRQKWLAKMRQGEYGKIISTLDKIFFSVFTLTISATVVFVFITPPHVVM